VVDGMLAPPGEHHTLGVHHGRNSHRHVGVGAGGDGGEDSAAERGGVRALGSLERNPRHIVAVQVEFESKLESNSCNLA